MTADFPDGSKTQTSKTCGDLSEIFWVGHDVKSFFD